MKDKIKNIIEFLNDDTLYYSASLSFFTIFSLLPILALVIVIMSSYSLFSEYIDVMMLYFLDFVNPTHSEQVTKTIKHFLANVHELGSLGIVYLLFVFTMFFKDYEYVVSKIHKTQRRSFIALVSLYVTFFLFIPITIVIIATISTFFEHSIIKIILSSFFSLFIFTVLFKISINKYINIKAAFISAFITLGVLKITQSLFIYYVFYNTTYTTIYGTLSVMLFLFLWIYISWSIYLYGIKLCYTLNMEYQKNVT